MTTQSSEVKIVCYHQKSWSRLRKPRNLLLFSVYIGGESNPSHCFLLFRLPFQSFARPKGNQFSCFSLIMLPFLAQVRPKSNRLDVFFLLRLPFPSFVRLKGNSIGSFFLFGCFSKSKRESWRNMLREGLSGVQSRITRHLGRYLPRSRRHA